jgi:hypothetical protein
MCDKMTGKPESASRSRRDLVATARAILSTAQKMAAERGPLLKGAFQLRGTRCGKDNCKCAQGELHSTAVLIVSEDGRRRSYYVRPSERPEVQRRVERYLALRANRAELSKLNAALLGAADELADALAEAHRPQRELEDGSLRRRGRGGRARR